MTTDSLRSRSSSGTMWSAASLVAVRVVSFISTMVLARIFDEEIFGLFGIGLLVISYLEFLNDFGIASAVINLSGRDDRLASVAYWINMALGVTLTAIGWFSAPFIADFFNNDDAVGIIRGLSFVFVLRSFGAVHEARLKRDLKMKQVTMGETSRALVKAFLTVALAFAGYGVWSLVWGQVVGTAVGSAVLMALGGWQPQRRLSKGDSLAGSRQLLGFGAQMTLIDILGSINKNIDYVFIGRSISTAALGVYTLAFRLPELLLDGVNLVVAKVAFPVFSELQDEPGKGREALRAMLRLTSAVLMPLGLGLAVCAGPLVRLAYGDKWLDAIEPVRWLSIALLATALTKNIGDLYKGYGRPGLLNVIGVAKMAVIVPLLFVVVRYGITAVAMAQAGLAVVISFFQLVIAARITDQRLTSMLAPYRSPLLAGAAMVAATWPLSRLVEEWPDLIQILTIVPVGAGVYLGILSVVDRTLFGEALAFVRAGLPKRSESDNKPTESVG